MRPIPSVLCVAGLLAACQAVAGTARVEWVNPERFTDAAPVHPHATTAEMLEPLRVHLVRRASERLPAGQLLDVWITDVDLAGDMWPVQRFVNPVRVVKNIYPPRVDLRFRLADANGAVLKEGSRTLRDTSFLLHRKGDPGDPLRYEKSMIDRWLHAELGR